jgi:fatty acid-binding protein DegV
MSSTCILTDSIAQFPQLGFSGRNDVRVVSFEVEINGKRYAEARELRTSDLPPTASEALCPRLIPPTEEYFADLFTNLSQHYDDIIAILTSSSLNPVSLNAQKAAKSVQGRSRVTVIDSQTTSVGLGLMVQTAAEGVANGMFAAEI